MTGTLPKLTSNQKHHEDVSVSANGATVHIHADGSVDAYTTAVVIAHTPDVESRGLLKAVRPSSKEETPADQQSAADPGRSDLFDASRGTAQPKPGDPMPDGTIYAGDSPDSGEPLYTTSVDAPRPLKWQEALDYAMMLDAHGHRDWRLPTKGELNVLFNNRATIGGFGGSDSNPDSRYWSGTQCDKVEAWDQSFNDGVQDYNYTANHWAVRCVRGARLIVRRRK